MSSDQYSVLGKAPSSDDLKKLSLSDVHLTIKQLSAGYGKMEILHNFDLFVGKAQSLCLIGPNGAGKSTILHSIYGFTNIFSGQIEINGIINRLIKVNKEFGITLLVIEHNMRVIMNLAQKIFCLAHGELLAEGLPEQIKNDKRVIEAYLGAR